MEINYVLIYYMLPNVLYVFVFAKNHSRIQLQE